jgi:RsiW-degrading membrane proteinase PrsW (M82 family)
VTHSDPLVVERVGPPRRVWLRMFAAGLLLWIAAVLVTFLTGNPNLIPTVVLLGSFLVPVTFVAWAFGRQDTGEITASRVVGTFVAGGVLGVLASSVLETYLLHPSVFLFGGVGLIEEAAKLGALVLLARHLSARSVRDGMILGAAVGFGFAAFESAGYAFTALFTVNGLSLLQLVQTEILRGILAPVGHGLWTAILGGVLFATTPTGRPRVTWRLGLAFLGVAALHALWDAMHGLARLLTLILTDGERYRVTSGGWIVQPSGEQAALFPIMEASGLLVVSLIGIAWLATSWRSARRSGAAIAPGVGLPHAHPLITGQGR